jgi:ElaB/YqjD/DUF883 family membrane-anchored ribosome-binding protein
MGCGGSTGSKKKIKMQITKLADVDMFFKDTQEVIDSIYELSEPIDDARDELLENTGFNKVCCASTHHAIVGVVFGVYATSKSVDNAVNAVDIKMESPFITFDTKKVSGPIAADVKALTTYIESLTKAKGKVESLGDKVKAIAEKAPELPTKAKDSLSKSKGLGAMDK